MTSLPCCFCHAPSPGHTEETEVETSREAANMQRQFDPRAATVVDVPPTFTSVFGGPHPSESSIHYQQRRHTALEGIGLEDAYDAPEGPVGHRSPEPTSAAPPRPAPRRGDSGASISRSSEGNDVSLASPPQRRLPPARGGDRHADLRRPATYDCLLYTSPSPRDQRGSRMPSSA